MDCRETREWLPLLERREGLPTEEAEAVEAHLARCAECRERAREVRDSILSLRSGLSDLYAEPPTEEEVSEMLTGVRMEPRRSRLVPLIAAAVLLVAVGIAFFAFSGGDDGDLFAVGPQVADAEGVRVQPPPLRIPRCRAWDRESRRILVTVHDGVYEMRLSYEPEDGKGRMRKLDPDRFAAPPAPVGGGSRRPVLLLAANPDTPWQDVRRAMRMFEPIKVYLAGLERDGTFGALPFFAGKGVDEIIRLGAAVAPQDIAAGAPEGGALELRITREAGGTRYRFGLWPFLTPDTPRFALGDKLLTDSDLATADGGPVPGSLSTHIAGLKRRPRGHRGVVFLQVGSGARYLDVLRAVECAGGLESFCFVHQAAPRELDLVNCRLPAPLTAEDGAALAEDLPRQARTVVNVSERGRMMIRGIESDLPAIDSAPGKAILLRADERAPWDICAGVLSRAQAAGKAIRIAFAPEDPAIHWERVLEIAPSAAGVNPVRIELDPGGPAPVLSISPAGVTLSAPDGATAGQVIPLVLRLVREGAVGFTFE